MLARSARVLLGVAGAVLAAACVGGVEARIVLRDQGVTGAASWLRVAAADWGTLAPLAAFVGATAAIAIVLVEPAGPYAPPHYFAVVRDQPILGRTRTAAVTLLVGACTPLWLVGVASSARWTLARGAAMASGVAIGTISVAVLLALVVGVAAATPPVRRMLARLAPSVPAAIDPVATGAVGLGVAVLVIGLGGGLGDTSGEGPTPLAILGVLKRPEIDARPLVGVVFLVLGAWAAPLVTRSTGVAALLVVGALGLTTFEATWLERNAKTALLLERFAPLGRVALAVDRRATDRDHDGASFLFGGGDCNDSDPHISPFAFDVPGNGIDEDCSGADSPLPVAVATATATAPRATSVPPVGAGGAVASDLNLVLVTVDALRADEMGFAGYGKPTTPNLDALAASSVVFERAYAMASYTGKALAPMLIGKYPSETLRDGGHFTRYLPGNVFLAERLQAAGFFTMGAASHWYFRDYFGLTQGFDTFDTSAVPGTGQNDGDTTVTGPQLTDAALRLLRAHAGQGRFFLWVHYFDPHAQYVPHDGAPDFSDGSRNRMRALYDGEVWFTDREVGRLLAFVREQPWAERTAVVLTSDHGEAMNEHGMGYKHGFELWEPLVRVPLLIRAPGIDPHRVTVKRSVVDLVPTLLDLMKIPQPPAGELSGQSLATDLLAAPPDGRSERDVYLDMPEGPYTGQRRAVLHGTTPGAKLIHFGGRQMQLFDLAADPAELHDLADDAAQLGPVLAAFSETRETVREIYVKPDPNLP